METPALHIHAPAGKYQVRVRPVGCRKYRLVGQPTRSLKTALERLAGAFQDAPNLKRGDILWCTELGYYEPTQLYELVRK